MLNEDGFCKSTLREDQGMVWGRFREHSQWPALIVCEEIVKGQADVSTTLVMPSNRKGFFEKYPDAVDDAEKLLSKEFPDAFKAAKPKKKKSKKK